MKKSKITRIRNKFDNIHFYSVLYSLNEENKKLLYKTYLEIFHKLQEAKVIKRSYKLILNKENNSLFLKMAK